LLDSFAGVVAADPVAVVAEDPEDPEDPADPVAVVLVVPPEVLLLEDPHPAASSPTAAMTPTPTICDRRPKIPAIEVSSPYSTPLMVETCLSGCGTGVRTRPVARVRTCGRSHRRLLPVLPL
jgi:hypothetical protein